MIDDLGVHIGVYQPCPRFFIRWLHSQSSTTTWSWRRTL